MRSGTGGPKPGSKFKNLKTGEGLSRNKGGNIPDENISKDSNEGADGGLAREKIEANAATCSTFLNGYCQTGQLDKAFELLDVMKKSDRFTLMSSHATR